MTKLKTIVEELLSQFVGGEAYFDKLDEVLRDPKNFDIIQNLFSSLSDSNVIMSGKFGYYALELFDNGLISVNSLIVVNGGLRKGEVKDIEVRNLHKNSAYVFVDDSFYKGRTRDKVAEFISKFHCDISHMRVVYDVSIEKDNSVTSMYRYHS